MKQFAHRVDGRTIEIIDEFITIDDARVPLADRYHQSFIDQLVPYDAENPPEEAPPDPVAPIGPVPLTDAQIRTVLDRLATEAGLSLDDLLAP